VLRRHGHHHEAVGVIEGTFSDPADSTHHTGSFNGHWTICH
jgi:hypothetical protein